MKAQFVPAGVDLIVTRNDGQKADAAVSGLIEHLDIAILAVFLVTAALLGLKEALIVGVTVPLILALTLGAAYLSGLTDLMLYWSTKQPPAKAGGFVLRTESPDTRRLNDASTPAPSGSRRSA